MEHTEQLASFLDFSSGFGFLVLPLYLEACMPVQFSDKVARENADHHNFNPDLCI